MYKKLLLILALGIFLISFTSAEASFCCERTISGSWCLNAPETECDTSSDYRSVPTSCEATSYCRLGVCINNQDGKCMPNTPQKVCNDVGGIWDERDKEDIPQCQLGCCLIGDQAAFVTQTKCKQLSSLYGLEMSYRTDIQNELVCISGAKPKLKGACAYEREYEKTCDFITKKECQEMPEDSGAEFYEGLLCSAEELETNCGPRGGTTCHNDKVYFLDTCGNLANVYDFSKEDDLNYWSEIQPSDCGDDSGSKDSATCGDCDYYLGSVCKEAELGDSVKYGNYLCKDLGCYEGSKKIAEHGETWCADVKGINNEDDNKNHLPGSRYFRKVCYDGEVSIEPCADFRQEVCVQSSVADFRTAACKANMWEDCFSQKNKESCENSDKRDCQWIKGTNRLFEIEKNIGASIGAGIGGGAAGFPVIGSIGSYASQEIEEEKEYSCVPEYTPGFDFWSDESDGESLCSLGNNKCTVLYYAGFAEGAAFKDVFAGGAGVQMKATDWNCVQECEKQQNGNLFKSITKILSFKGIDVSCLVKCAPMACVDENRNPKKKWLEEMNNFCVSLGDCGVKENYIGKEGYHDLEDLYKSEKKEKETASGGGGIFGALGGLFG